MADANGDPIRKRLLLAYWINARERMRVKKELGLPQPWTDDPLLANYRWCNVRREDDKVTRFIRNEWSRPYYGSENMLLAMVVARFVNRISSLKELGFPINGVDPTHFLDVAMTQKPFWGNAYTISTCGAKMSKARYVLDVFEEVAREQATMNRLFADCQQLSIAHVELTRVFGMGSFLAAQVLADLKWTPGHPLETARDRYTWAAPGPGSRRGLDRYDGREPAPGVCRWLARLRRAAEETTPRIDPVLWENNLKHMDMQDWQSCMCEFDKYCRLKEGGHVRNKYTPVA